MKNRFASVLAAAALMFASATLASASPQDEENTRAARAEMAKLAPLMEGRWKGTGRFRVSRDTTVETESEEIISLQLGGSALLIEGIHRDARSKVMVHHAMGLLAWDVGRAQFRMSTALSQGRTGYFPGKLEGRTFTWTMEGAGGPLTRFTIDLDPPGRWAEIGESSRDGGKTWFKFFEMTLERTAQAPASR